jgi:hypothetical protein
MANKNLEGRAALRKSGALLFRRLRAVVKEMDKLSEMVERKELDLEDLRAIYSYLQQLRAPYGELYEMVEKEGRRLHQEQRQGQPELPDIGALLERLLGIQVHAASPEKCAECEHLPTCDQGREILGMPTNNTPAKPTSARPGDPKAN